MGRAIGRGRRAARWGCASRQCACRPRLRPGRTVRSGVVLRDHSPKLATGWLGACKWAIECMCGRPRSQTDGTGAALLGKGARRVVLVARSLARQRRRARGPPPPPPCPPQYEMIHLEARHAGAAGATGALGGACRGQGAAKAGDGRRGGGRGFRSQARIPGPPAGKHRHPCLPGARDASHRIARSLTRPSGRRTPVGYLDRKQWPKGEREGGGAGQGTCSCLQAASAQQQVNHALVHDGTRHPYAT